MVNKLLHNYFPEIAAQILRKSVPLMVTVNLTSKCNLNCIYCELNKNHPSIRTGELIPSDLYWIIDQMVFLKIPKISMCGGEPFLFEGIIDIVEYAWKNKIRCSITTNGMLVHKLNKQELKILKSSGTEINISIDSFQEKIQAMTRGMSESLSNALNSIAVLNEQKIPITVLTVISKYNYHELSDFIITAYKNGIKQVLFQPVIFNSNYPDRVPLENKMDLIIRDQEIEIMIEELKKILHFERRYGIKTNVYRILPWIRNYLITAHDKNGRWFFEEVLKKFWCRDLHAIIDISYDGGIQPCPFSLAEISIHENRHLGLMVLWKNATANIKSRMENGDYLKACNACCNHFSRNMIASIMKYPIENRAALYYFLPAIIIRMLSSLVKKARMR